MNPSIRLARSRWIEGLIEAGFEESDSGYESLSLVREFEVPTADGSVLEDSIVVTIGPDFPYKRPEVRTRFSATGGTWHRERDGTLCLWPRDNSVSDLPWKDPAVLVGRIKRWLANSAEGWTDDLPILDLERYVGMSDTKFVFDTEDIEFQDKAFFNVSISTSGGAAHYEMGSYVRRPPVATDRKRSGHSTSYGAAVDLGELSAPFGTWEELTALMPSDFAEKVRDFVRMKKLDLLVVRYSREGNEAVTVLELGLKDKLPAVVGALTPVPGSRAVRMLRAGDDAGLLAERTVAVVGVGAVGSYVADFLVRRGVGQVLLMDFDDMRPGNSVRHLAADQSLELMPKVEAVKSRLDAYGFVEGNSISVSGSGLLKVESAISLLGGYHVVVDATASGECSALLSDLAREETAFVVAVAIQRAGGVYRVDRYPGDGHYEAIEGLKQPTDQALRLEVGCADPVSPTTPDAVAEAAIWAVRVVIDLLLGTEQFGPTVLGVVEPQADAPLDRLGIVVS